MSKHPAPHALTPATTVPAVGIYRVDPDASSILFTTRHLFGLGEVRGSMSIRDGQVTVARELEHCTVSATMDAGSFDSGSAGRDKVVKSEKFLSVDEHPDIAFAATAVVPDGPAWRVRGTLTARGVVVPVDVTITDIAEHADGMTLRAAATVDRYAHGLTKSRGLAARHLRVLMTVRANRS